MPITKTINFLPAVFQSDTNKRFLNATLDQLMTEPNLVPINGYVGRKFAPGFKGINTYVKEPTALRADYQLEPGVVVKNKETGEVDFHTTYPEVLQKIDFGMANGYNEFSFNSKTLGLKPGFYYLRLSEPRVGMLEEKKLLVIP